MKSRIILSLFLCLFLTVGSQAQMVNWRALKDESSHLISANFGADYSFNYGISYGNVLFKKSHPSLIGIDFSLPFGEDVFDDWVWKTNISTELWTQGNFSLSGKTGMILRNYHSPLAQMKNAGFEVSATVGYLKKRWGISVHSSYEGSIATKIRHTGLADYYPEIKDGWYGAAGGNFRFGAIGNLNFGSWNTFILIGKHFGKDFRDNPTFPFFFDLKIQKQLTKTTY